MRKNRFKIRYAIAVEWNGGQNAIYKLCRKRS